MLLGMKAGGKRRALMVPEAAFLPGKLPFIFDKGDRNSVLVEIECNVVA